MEITFLAAAYVLHGPESLAYVLIAYLFALWRKWIHEWSALLLYLLPFGLLWPLVVHGVSVLQTEPAHPDVAYLAKWASIAVAIFWASISRDLWRSIAKRDQRVSRWWVHLLVFATVLIGIALLGEGLLSLSRTNAASGQARIADQAAHSPPPIGNTAPSDSQSTAPIRVTLQSGAVISFPSDATNKEIEEFLLLNFESSEVSPPSGTQAADASRNELIAMIHREADAGDRDKQYTFAELLSKGRWIEQNLAAAAIWYERAAEQGVASAQVALGDMNSEGRGVPRNDSAAASWYRKASDQGNAEGQRKLAQIYAAGVGVPRDDAKAFSLFLLAAEKGDAESQFQVGVRLHFQTGVPRDLRGSVYWYERAAQQGHVGAQLNLGGMYSVGAGTPKNDQRAYFWWLLASASGDPSAARNRDNLEPRLTPQQRADAQRDASAWKAQPATQ
jgi:TPR repeat protein